jgi:hypothetical protein
MRRMSFALTKRQYLDCSKTQTRRLGYENLEPGEIVMGVEKMQGLRKGEKQVELWPFRTINTRRERLDAITPADVIAEGFPGMTPAAFVVMFCEVHKHKHCTPSTIVTRIVFELINPRPLNPIMSDDAKRPGILPIDETALAMIKRFGLAREDGTARCINDHCNGDATFPTLECTRCLASRRRT